MIIDIIYINILCIQLASKQLNRFETYLTPQRWFMKVKDEKICPVKMSTFIYFKNAQILTEKAKCEIGYSKKNKEQRLTAKIVTKKWIEHFTDTRQDIS